MHHTKISSRKINVFKHFAMMFLDQNWLLNTKNITASCSLAKQLRTRVRHKMFN